LPLSCWMRRWLPGRIALVFFCNVARVHSIP
jgi:hypothetical protein